MRIGRVSVRVCGFVGLMFGEVREKWARKSFYGGICSSGIRLARVFLWRFWKFEGLIVMIKRVFAEFMVGYW